VKQNLLILGALATSAVLLFAADVKTDFDHAADFSRYRTYSWIKADANNSLWADRIQRDLDTALASKGWSKVGSGGDASVAALGFTRNEQSLLTFYDGFGGGWFWRGWGGPGYATTTVDIFDSQSKKLIWRGTGSHVLSDKPEHNEKKLEDSVQDMFKHFPPPSRG